MQSFYIWHVVLGLTSILTLAFIEYVVCFRGKESTPYNWPDIRTSLLLLVSTYTANFLLQPLLLPYYSFFESVAFWRIGPRISDSLDRFFSLGFFSLILADDLLYYLHHRLQHRVEFLWRIHAAHHSSQSFTTLTVARISPFDLSVVTVWPVLVYLGYDPLLVLLVHSMNINYNIFLHHNLVGKLGCLEWFLMTPTHHRIHHSSQDCYKGANLGGVFIFWDRFFGTFRSVEREGVPVAHEKNRLTYTNSALAIILNAFSRPPKTERVAKILDFRKEALETNPILSSSAPVESARGREA